jgi:hypothetical protein
MHSLVGDATRILHQAALHSLVGPEFKELASSLMIA